MMETASADKPDLIPGVDGEPVIQVVIPTQTSKAMPSASTVVSSGENDVHVKTDGLGTMQQRENSNPKSRCILILIINCFVAFFPIHFIFERGKFFIFLDPFMPPSLPPKKKKKKTGPCREGLPALEGCWLRHWARPRVVVLASARSSSGSGPRSIHSSASRSSQAGHQGRRESLEVIKRTRLRVARAESWWSDEEMRWASSRSITACAERWN